MNRLLHRAILLLSVVFGGIGLDAPARGQDVVTSLDEFLARGVDLERQRLWQQAADVYERALRLFPERPELRERWHKSERLYSLSRRYHDPSYVGELLHLSPATALELYEEVLTKIEAHYVEPVALDRLVKHGYRTLDLALTEQVFLDAVGAAEAPSCVEAFRAVLSERGRSKVSTVEEAKAEALTVAELFAARGAKSKTAVILEFLSAASEGLDPYSAHLTPNRLRDLYSTIDGNFVGLGVEVRGIKEGLQIVQVLPDSPAEEAGLNDGEVIEAVDGQSIVGVNAEDSANRLQGRAGSVVVLRVRGAANAVRDVAVVRREVIVHSVTAAHLLEATGGIGYIRLTSFQKLTVGELEQAVARLVKEGMTSLILDLRGNPGGLLDVALQVANHFIDRGVLVSTQGRAWGQSWSHRAHPSRRWDFPLVVLIDGDSASASEILAGAVKDHHRGTIVGTRSYGKGSVQSIFPLRTVATGLRLTTAHFYSPNGLTYQNVGVTPDVVVERAKGPLGEERPLPKHIDVKNDPQLRRGVEVLTSNLARR